MILTKTSYIFFVSDKCNKYAYFRPTLKSGMHYDDPSREALKDVITETLSVHSFIIIE